jgi:autotransporter-associated beta strand protein
MLDSTNPHVIELTGPEAMRFVASDPAEAVLRTGHGAGGLHLTLDATVEAPILAIDTAATSSISLAGALAGTATLRKTGPGVLELMGSNVNWSGPIAVQGGTLVAGHADAMGGIESGVQVQAGAILDLLQPSAEPIEVHSGTVHLNYGNGAHLGGIAMNGGTLGGNTLGFPELQGPLEIVGGSTVTVESARPAQIVLRGGVHGTGTLRFRSSIDNFVRGVGINHNGGVIFEMQEFANVTIEAPSTYAGSTVVNSGGVMVEHSEGLGSPTVGTVINGGGLALNVSSLEPVEVHEGVFYLWARSSAPTYAPQISMYGGELDAFSFSGDTITVVQPVAIHEGATVSFRTSSQDILALSGGITGDGDVILNPYNEIQVRGPIATTGDVTILSNTHFHAANTFPGDLIVENGPLTVHVDNTVSGLEILNGRLNIVDGATLTAHEIRLRRGIIDGRLAGVDTLRKLGLDFVELVNLGPEFDPRIVIPEGVIIVSGATGLGTIGHSTEVTGSRNAALQIPQLLTTNESIELRNATGFGLGGGLILKRTDGSAEPVILGGNLDLGDVGSTIGLPDTRLRFDGEVSGGALTARGFGLGQLILTGAGHTYTGPTELIGVGLMLREQGVLQSTPTIRVWSAGELIVENAADGILVNRVSDETPVYLHGARLTLQGRDSVASTEMVGRVILQSGASEIASFYDGDVSPAILTISQLERATGATVHFRGTNTLGAADNSSKVLLANSHTRIVQLKQVFMRTTLAFEGSSPLIPISRKSTTACSTFRLPIRGRSLTWSTEAGPWNLGGRRATTASGSLSRTGTFPGASFASSRSPTARCGWIISASRSRCRTARSSRRARAASLACPIS